MVKETKLLSIPQFAEELCITQACVRRWVLERKIASTRIGRLVRIPGSEIQRLIDSGYRPARRER